MPFVKVEFIRGDNSVRTEGLLDSGSHASIFHAEFAEAIGVDFAKGDPIQFESAAGHYFWGYQHRVNVRLAGKHTIPNALIAFTPETNPKYGLIGQDLFRFFGIRFVASQMFAEITRKRGRY
jgi:hypothetical protein